MTEVTCYLSFKWKRSLHVLGLEKSTVRRPSLGSAPSPCLHLLGVPAHRAPHPHPNSTTSPMKLQDHFLWELLLSLPTWPANSSVSPKILHKLFPYFPGKLSDAQHPHTFSLKLPVSNPVSYSSSAKPLHYHGLHVVILILILIPQVITGFTSRILKEVVNFPWGHKVSPKI